MFKICSFLLIASLPGFTLHAVADAETAVPVFESREAIPKTHKWDMELFYPSWEAWDVDLHKAEGIYEEVMGYKGRFSEGPATLLETLQLMDQGGILLDRLFGYAAQMRDLDTRDNTVQAQFGRMIQTWSRIGAQLSWIDPEILSLPRETMEAWIDSTPGLEPYRFGLIDTYRTGEFTLDEDGERLLSLHSQVRGSPRQIYSALTNADGDQPVIKLSDGEDLTVTAGTYSKVLSTNRNSADRKAVQKARMEQFNHRRNTFAALYNGVVQQNWALTQSRGYESSLEMNLNRNDIPVEVVTSLVAAAREGADQLQRYHNVRKKLLGLESYGWSDMFVSLTPHQKDYSYEEIVPWVIDSVSFLGEEYHSKMDEQMASGLVDVYETPGKRTGAYNSGTYGVGSFVLLNYQGTLNDVFTVAHELGHSMHTRLSQDYQPFPTHRYTIFVAEVASTLNEKLLLDKLLAEVKDPQERIAFIEQQLSQIFGTYFLQTMMADFEMQAHGLVENGEGLTADSLTELWQSIVKVYFGEVIPEDDPYMHSWARIPHLYNSPFYVYQYATCYASSSSLMKQMREDPSTVDRYLELLKSGGNDHPMNQLKKAGVDLTQPQILHAVIEEFGQLIDLLEVEYGRYLDQTRQDQGSTGQMNL
jgi:oligoendopeptidase F